MVEFNQYGQNETMGQGSPSPILTPSLCRAARGMLDWTQNELAERSSVSRSTIRDYEGARHELHRATAAQLIQALEAGGVIFLEIEGLGVALAERR
jgi:transcriptional regulator with XRE-family HTH domain